MDWLFDGNGPQWLSILNLDGKVADDERSLHLKVADKLHYDTFSARNDAYFALLNLQAAKSRSLWCDFHASAIKYLLGFQVELASLFLHLGYVNEAIDSLRPPFNIKIHADCSSGFCSILGEYDKDLDADLGQESDT